MTLSEIKKELVNQGYQLICLYSERNEKLINYNQTPRSGKAHADTIAHWKKIEAYIESSLTPDGIYQIGAKLKGVKSPEMFYRFTKGKVQAPAQTQVTKEVVQKSSSEEITWEEYKALLLRNAELEAEIVRLESIIQQMQQEDEDDEQFADEPQSGQDKLFSVLADKLATPGLFDALLTKFVGVPTIPAMAQNFPTWEHLCDMYQANLSNPVTLQNIEEQMKLYYPEQYAKAKANAGKGT
ncbi:MAG: hypothetical protein VKL39_21700 [Leptolyngbyaceae bacterium]|nr:hypothetical protein [Leptolyngbyaceae bacterium]